MWAPGSILNNFASLTSQPRD